MKYTEVNIIEKISNLQPIHMFEIIGTERLGGSKIFAYDVKINLVVIPCNEWLDDSGI
jgi:hypothetical protein